MEYKALYRQWRPQSFQEIVGQSHISETLRNAVKRQRIAHAYLFTGPRGTGKTSTAKILAKAVNCLAVSDGEPCNKCANCCSINEGRSLDVLEIDAASNRGIDEIRDIRERVNFAPSQGSFKVYIIDEVHMLTTEAFNALLKTLEEPPAHVIFILATTEPQKIPATILSRCQRFDFHKIALREMEERLRKIMAASGITADEGVLEIIVKKAEGGLRDAIGILDQCMAFCQENIPLQTAYDVLGMVKGEALTTMTGAIADKDAARLMSVVNELFSEGVEPVQIIKDLLEHLRNMIILEVCGSSSQLVVLPEEEREALIRQAKILGADWLSKTVSQLAKIDAESRWRQNMRIVLETTLLSLLYEGEEEYAEKKGKEQKAPSKQKHAKNEEVVAAKQAVKTAGKPLEEKDIVAGPDAVIASVSSTELREKWPTVMELVKKKKKTAHAFLAESRPLKSQGREFVLCFKPGYDFHRERIESQENKEMIEDILKKVFGEKLCLKCIMEETKGEKTGDDPVQRAIEIFGPDVVEIEE